MDISFWSPVDGSNTFAVPDGFPEGQPAKSLNDCSRAVMGAVRRQWELKEWFNWGHSYTFTDGTTITVEGTHATTYHENRRIWATGTLTGDVYGRITNVVETSDTVLTVEWDSGNLVPEVDSSEQVRVGSAVTGAPVAAEGVNGVDRVVPEDGGFVVGDLKWQSHTVVGTNWRECNGQSLVKASYPALDALYSADGYPWGESGSNLLLPNLKGRAVIGRGQGETTDRGGVGTNFLLGQLDGTETHILTETEMPSHTHGYSNRPADSFEVEGGVGTGNSVRQSLAAQTSTGTGGNGPHENTSPIAVGIIVVKVL